MSHSDIFPKWASATMSFARRSSGLLSDESALVAFLAASAMILRFFSSTVRRRRRTAKLRVIFRFCIEGVSAFVTGLEVDADECAEPPAVVESKMRFLKRIARGSWSRHHVKLSHPQSSYL